jgi:hypothetical protein
VKTDRGDWDREEREAIAGLDEQLEAMRRRHAGDPPFELLRAAHGDALPSDLQAAVSEHIASNELSRTLAEGLGDDEPELTSEDRDRLYGRIMTAATTPAEPTSGWGWLRPIFLGSGIVAVAALVWLVSIETESPERLGPPERTVVVATPPAAPPFLLAFDKPEVRLGMAALTWRGAPGDNQLLADLKPGLDAYRQGDYATANRELTALESRYPATIEVLFYQGVSRLFLNDLDGAIGSLTAAEAIGDRTFAADVTWYRAVAEQHAGNVAAARTRLDALCRAKDDGAARACAAIEEMTKADATAP